jgi:hypothetical protein
MTRGNRADGGNGNTQRNRGTEAGREEASVFSVSFLLLCSSVFYRSFRLLHFLLASAFVLEVERAHAQTLQTLQTLEIPRTPPPELEALKAGRFGLKGKVAEFRQRDPGDGEPASRNTTAFVSYDEKNLWIAFVCEDEPQEVRAHLTRREAIAGDDQVIVYLDTFRDGQRAYFFAANPLGVQRDGIFSEGQEDDDSFDTLWESEGKLTDTGYVVRMRIPFKSLRFSSTAEQSWGIALGRIIQRNNEESYWPYITKRVQGFVQQFGRARGLENISPGRNVQFIPYGISTGARYLDGEAPGGPSFTRQGEVRSGLDSKVVVRDAFAFDLALNPDFSQVESDEPQVTINQRFEVFFPERRPFFLENAGFFQTPTNLFFSRRVADPQLGIRLTGKAGRWALGGLASDDRAPGLAVAPGDSRYGDRTLDGVMSVRREFGEQSSLGFLATTRDFGQTSNRVLSVDARFKLNSNWVLAGQAMRSATRPADGEIAAGTGSVLELTRDGRHFGYAARYTDLSPEFRSELGYVKRVDIRQLEQEAQYRWRPRDRAVVKYGPTIKTVWNRDRAGRVQDWSAEGQFKIDFIRETKLELGHEQAFELFEDTGFRKRLTTVTFSTEWLNWLAGSAAYRQGTVINFDPAPGLLPSLGDAREIDLTLALRPSARLVIEQTFIDNRLDARPDFALPAGSASRNAFVNRIARWKLNYQFTRPLSLRWILDYATVAPNASLVSLEREKRLQGDLLLTYLVHPGTSVYVGYTDRQENLAIESTTNPTLRRTESILNTGRQFFVKMSYLFRL